MISRASKRTMPPFHNSKVPFREAHGGFLRGLRVFGAFAFLAGGTAFATSLRFATTPTLSTVSGGALVWTASVACEDPPALIGARVAFAFDFDLDGAPDAVDTLGISAADCDDSAAHVALRRLLRPAHPALLRATLLDAAGAPADSHAVLTSGLGGLLAIARYCARPANGEPEWIEVRNGVDFPVSLTRARLDGRAFAGGATLPLDTLPPGSECAATPDTAELRLWRPGARLVMLSSWTNLRNSGDTIRLSLSGGPTLDSVIYPWNGAWPREQCVSQETEEAAASAHGFGLTLPAPARWRAHQGPFAIDVRASDAGRYDLRVYDLDGRPLCALARGATGSATYTLPHAICADLGARRGTFLLHLDPRDGPGVRRMFTILP